MRANSQDRAQDQRRRAHNWLWCDATRTPPNLPVSQLPGPSSTIELSHGDGSEQHKKLLERLQICQAAYRNEMFTTTEIKELTQQLQASKASSQQSQTASLLVVQGFQARLVARCELSQARSLPTDLPCGIRQQREPTARSS